MIKPVYIFTGFIESGKTTLINETLKDPGFTNQEKTLVLLCEEGEIPLIKQDNLYYQTIENQEDITNEYLQSLEKKYNIDRIMIEYNGTWSLKQLLETELPLNWKIVQILTTINANTFKLYINNMRTFLYEQIYYSEAVIFNRCKQDIKKNYLRTNILSINRSTQIIYENEDGTLNNQQDEELPYDITQDTIIITIENYGLFYMDMLDKPKKYEGKTVQLTAKVIRLIPEIKNSFALGRSAMVCCGDDIQEIGFVCISKDINNIKINSYIEVEAQIEYEYDQEQEALPLLYIKKYKEVKAIENDMVYFN
ncbi:MAG: GTP-binding protein [Erysipelotrichaceae bacterium]